MQYDPPLTFHHNFSEPVKIPGSYNLYYDPVQVDRMLTKLLIEGDPDYENTRHARAARR
jgi:alpha-D-ribose 1-methylphosphonate 5-phosphate C-P lyase